MHLVGGAKLTLMAEGVGTGLCIAGNYLNRESGETFADVKPATKRKFARIANSTDDGMTKVAATVTTGVEMGAARPPYPAPDGAAVRLGKRLLALNEAL